MNTEKLIEMLSDPLTATVMFIIVGVVGAAIILGIGRIVWGIKNSTKKNLWGKKVYLCTNRGVTGLMLAATYDSLSERFWRAVNEGSEPHPGPEGPCLLVHSWLFLFIYTDRNRDKDFDLQPTGTMADLAELVKHCPVERARFFVPLKSGGKHDTHNILKDYAYRLIYGDEYHRHPRPMTQKDEAVVAQEG